MTKLSVNINKVATLRNARGGNVPNVVKVALDCEVNDISVPLLQFLLNRYQLFMLPCN